MGKQRRTVSVKVCGAGGASVVRVAASRRDSILSEGRGDEGSAEHELIGSRRGRTFDQINARTASLPWEREAAARAWDNLIALDWRSLAEAGTLGGVRLA